MGVGGGEVLCICGGVGEQSALIVAILSPLFFFTDRKTIQCGGLYESVYGNVARESKVEVVEGGLNHINM